MKDIQTNLKITEGYFPRLFMIFFCMLWTLGLFAQSTREVKGVVKDPTGETVIGASVLEKGTTNGTITDFDGNFELPNVEKGAVYPIHSPKFIADEDALPIGSAILSQTAVDYLDTYNN